MIKFFRKIRYSLMEQNKTGKYLKYAIGEIVLVMVGILLALQVNNWNTNRLLKLEEIQILENLAEEFSQNQLTLQETINKRQVQLDVINKYLSSAFNISGDNRLVHLDSLIAMSRFIPTFESRNGVLQDVLNSGKLNIIQNKRIRKILSNWNAELDDLAKKEAGLEHVILNNLNPYLIENYGLRHSDYIIVNKLFNDYSEINHQWTPNLSKNIFDKNAILNDVRFESIISLVNLWSVSGQRTSLSLEGKITNTMRLIQNELTQN